MKTFLARSAVVAFCASVAFVGCAAAEEDDVAGEGSSEGTDNRYAEEDIVSESQLMGTQLGAKQLALTFDDGPGPRTSELSAYLKAQGIPATFFINGKNVPGRQNVLNDILRDGHILANHTQNHIRLTASSTNAVEEITETDGFIKAVQPGGPWLLRPPFGAWSGRVARATNASGMSKYVGSVFWDIGGEMGPQSAADWACWNRTYRYSVRQCGDLYMAEIRKRGHGIVLLHDIHSSTVDMVKRIVPTLKAEGYSFVRLTDVPSIKSRMSAMPTPSTCYSSTLGRNIAEGGCVKAARDGKWYVCQDENWNNVTSETDVACKRVER